MAREKKCPTCHAGNPGDAMFCQECGDYLTKSDRFSIEKKIAQSHCPQCGHYNPIERKTCESCSGDLDNQQGAMFRDEHGRLRIVQEKPPGILTRLMCAATVVACMGLAGRMLFGIFKAAGQDPLATAKHPLGIALLAYLLVAALTAGQRASRLTYKAQACFTLLLGALYTLRLAFGGGVAVWQGVPLDRIFLGMHAAGLIYCLLFLLRAEFLRQAMTSAFFMLGLWCLYPTLLWLFRTEGYDSFVAAIGRFWGLPLMATPGFLTFNVFLPYVFLMMLARLGHQFSEANAYVVNNLTDKVVVRQFRRRQMRGVFLDLFTGALLLAAGMARLHALGKFNLLTPFLLLAKKLGI